MPRNMSFMLTTDQIRNRSKTVTRRIGWASLQPGDIVNACVKCQGLKPGEKIQRLCQIRIVSVKQEFLRAMYAWGYGHCEAKLEGFPDLTGRAFVEMFCREMKCQPHQIVRRIEFEYVD